MYPKNPIYIEHYSHEGCDCFKIDNPWTLLAKQTLVLCKVSEGLSKAEKLAKKQIKLWLNSGLSEDVLKARGE